jgi:UDPglucose 6-dehydrogenase
VSTPTNYDEKTNFFDTSAVEAVISQVVHCEPKASIVVKSTIPVGFIDNLRRQFKTNAIVFSPEFLREGKALYDNLHPSRIIVGDKSEHAVAFANLLAKGSLTPDVEILLTGTREAEAIKLFSNTYLAMRISFFNELDSYGLSKGINSRQVIEGVSLDPRIGNYYNNPSFGYGGYCLPKDTKQLLANYNNVPQKIISAIVDANATRKDFLLKEILKKQPKTVGIYRLVMKSDSDNFRQSSVLGIMRRLKSKGINIVVYEPELSQMEFFNSKVENDFEMFVRDVDLIVANRVTLQLEGFEEKIFTRDIFGVN